ncbi:hypothetical protein SNOG_12174 [Parastagonospora nodorum SN15]|uniref:Uncharacterized protein n=1 Tax=Phaeosphaeria nodorum (strain SN15 / ATCC MYA-4574 / FGSC 10173) TaxID=321614 RepID=Q0U7U0_PHANO|nr:hypothetical protein SNOG_12174 [Parastagonospora nodorum SN15]EAT80586.1 hypothetical protein SNOG_12174 [Parastagonospora nodorum SN15]
MLMFLACAKSVETARQNRKNRADYGMRSGAEI